MDMAPNRDRMQRACGGIIRFLQEEVSAQRITHAEALACMATSLGLLLKATDDQHRDQAVEMSKGIIADVLQHSPPEAA